MDRFLLAENPMLDRDRPVYIFHTQNPKMLIQVHHEAVAYGDERLILTGNYENSDGVIETITLEVVGIYSAEIDRISKVLNKAWHWYIAYLEWEDKQIEL
jgi:hypothetical protein